MTEENKQDVEDQKGVALSVTMLVNPMLVPENADDAEFTSKIHAQIKEELVVGDALFEDLESKKFWEEHGLLVIVNEGSEEANIIAAIGVKINDKTGRLTLPFISKTIAAATDQETMLRNVHFAYQGVIQHLQDTTMLATIETEVPVQNVAFMSNLNFTASTKTCIVEHVFDRVVPPVETPSE